MKKTTFLIVGKHAVLEALKNPVRRIQRVFLTEDAKKNLSEEQYISTVEREEQLKIRAQSYAWRIEE